MEKRLDYGELWRLRKLGFVPKTKAILNSKEVEIVSYPWLVGNKCKVKIRDGNDNVVVDAKDLIIK